MTMKVLGIGETVLDKVYITDTLEIADTSQLRCEKHIGGPVIAALILLARLGIDCTLMTTLGRDDSAEVIKHTLKHENVKLISKLQKKTKVHTVIVNTDNGQRKKVRGNIVHPPIKNITRKFLHQFDVIIVDRHEHTAFYEVLRKKKASTKIIIDPSTEISPFTLDMITYADYPIIPIEALTKLTETKTFAKALEFLYTLTKKSITITAGEFGSIIFDGKTTKLIPSLKIQPLDVTGAGDIYRGGFAYGVIQGWSLEQCATFGNLVAGIQCARIGNVAAIASKKEIELFKHILVQKKQITESTITNYFTHL